MLMIYNQNWFLMHPISTFTGLAKIIKSYYVLTCLNTEWFQPKGMIAKGKSKR